MGVCKCELAEFKGSKTRQTSKGGGGGGIAKPDRSVCVCKQFRRRSLLHAIQTWDPP